MARVAPRIDETMEKNMVAMNALHKLTLFFSSVTCQFKSETGGLRENLPSGAR